jgi:hypothetical protein
MALLRFSCAYPALATTSEGSAQGEFSLVDKNFASISAARCPVALVEQNRASFRMRVRTTI